MAQPSPIQVEGLNHYFREGSSRKQVLFDITASIGSSEIVILTGPSGSGKTTVLTLIGALRTVQEGSVTVLGHQLNGANDTTRVRVRRQIGFIFQHHNLLDSLTATENVMMAPALQEMRRAKERRIRALQLLEAVDLAGQADHHPRQLSGGEKQRVAIARALVAQPKVVLADEPTASLDKKSGRDVVDLMQKLAKEQGVPVLLVTHDSRILDVADRIIHLEDGKLHSFSDAVLANTQHMMSMLAQENRRGDLSRRVVDMPADQFITLLEHVTADAENFLRASDLASSEAFESMLEQVLEAFTRKIGDILHADRASLFLLDEARGEIWSKVARDGGGKPFEIRLPRGAGVAGAVIESGESLNIRDAYSDPRFDQNADRRSGYRTKSILCVPLNSIRGEVFGVAQLLNKNGGESFDADDERRFREFMASMGIILESWWQMSRRA